MKKAGAILIDGWRIDAEAHRILRGEVEVKLEPRCLALLLYLADHPGEVLSRAAIEEQVWQGRVVGYEAVSSSVAKIRKAFGDNGKPHRVIETISKSGYRLVASVSRGDKPDILENEDADSIVTRPVTISKLVSIVTMLCLFAAGLAWWRPWLGPAQPSIAVLPFSNLSGNPGQADFVDGLTDDLITDLSKIDGLMVISRNSTFTYKDKPVNIREVGQTLNVNFVMEGSVERQGSQVRINAQLIDAATDSHVWADRYHYQGNLDDLFTIRDEILRKIVVALSVKLVGPGQVDHYQAETANAEAYEALLRGQSHYHLFTPDDLVDAIPFLERALELDPNFGRAHAVSAAVYWGIYNNGWAESAGLSYEFALQRVEAHLTEALKRPTPLAHRIAARWHEYFGRPNQAMIEAEKAIALDPNNPNGYEGMSALLVNQDRADEGLAYIEMAIRLDPLSDYLWRLAYAQYHLEHYEAAVQTLRRGTQRNPDFDWNYLLLAAAYGHLGHEEEARSALATFDDVRINRLGKKKRFTLADLQYWSIKTEAGLTRLRQGMRKAGVPES